MSLDYNLIAGLTLSVLLIASAVLGWLGDMKRVGASTSARESATRSKRPKAQQKAQPRPAAARSARAQEQEDRIRETYFAKERKAREFRERQRRQQQSRQRTRSATGGSSRSTGTHSPPPSASSQEATYRHTLQLKGAVTKASLRSAYRKLIAAYHPDRCATLGIKLQKLAEEETKRINEAYSYFRRQLKP